MIRQIDDYWVDHNNNKWRTKEYIKSKAQIYSDTLINCKDCYDSCCCENCQNVIMAMACFDCVDCGGCIDCKDCEDCLFCIECDHCTSCSCSCGLKNSTEVDGYNFDEAFTSEVDELLKKLVADSPQRRN